MKECGEIQCALLKDKIEINFLNLLTMGKLRTPLTEGEILLTFANLLGYLKS
jgi:hypothetical protein